MGSYPAVDANVFSGELELSTWRAISGDPNKPLNNRAISAVYPPGSTFKLLAAAAGLSEAIIEPGHRVNCPGYYKFAGRKYRCHKRGGHGTVNLQQAVAMSCNAFFYELGINLGVDLIGQYAKLLGIGQITGIDLPQEVTGVVPSREWKVRRFGEKWYPGDTIPISIGQGYITVTPLQLTLAIASIANGGDLLQPRIVKEVDDPLSDEGLEFQPFVRSSFSHLEPSFKFVREYAESVVNGERGTGKRAHLEGVRVGGKTGTAQVAALSRVSQDEESLRDHALFVGFAPVQEPQIAFAVIVENAGHGGVAAAPIAKEILEAYFIKRGVLLKDPIEEKEVLSRLFSEQEAAL